jgi:hypothetical protein
MLIAISILASQKFTDIPILECPIVQTQPKLDGKASEECWGKATSIPYFVGAASCQEVRPRSSAKLFTDGKRLYLMVEMRDGVPPVGVKPKERDELKWGNSLEILIAPRIKSSRFYHFKFDPHGTIWDTIGKSRAFDHNFDVEYAVKPTNDGWILEVALPFKDFGLVDGVKRGDILGFNLYRLLYGSKFPASSWSPTLGPQENPKRFGRLIIGTYADGAQKLVASILPKKIPTNFRDEAQVLKNESKRARTVEDFKRIKSQAQLLVRKINAINFKKNGLVFWQCNPWDLPNETFLPQKDFSEKIYHIDTLQNEFVSFALGVANPHNDPVRVRCVPTTMFNLKTGEVAKFNKFISLRQVLSVGMRGGIILRDALPTLTRSSAFDIRAYSNEVVWLEVDTRKIPAGEWIFSLDFAPLVKRKFRTRAYFRLNVAPLRRPKSQQPYVFGWSRYPWPPALHTVKACLQDQKDHYLNVHLLTRTGRETGIHSLKFNKDERIINKPDLSALRTWLKLGSPGDMFIFGIGYLIKQFDQSRIDPAIAKENFKKYIDAVYAVVDEYKIPKERFLWYIADEPNMKIAKELLPVAKMFKEARPDKYATFVTYCVRAREETIRLLAPYITNPTIKFTYDGRRRTLIKKLARKDATIGGYGVLARAEDPYRRFRLIPLLSKSRGHKNTGFWNYCDSGMSYFSDAWDDYSGSRPHFTMIYDGDDKPVPSVRWEAYRQGVLDWKYIDWIRAELDGLDDTKLKEQAESLCSKALSAPFKSSDKTIADKIRSELRNMILRIKVAKKELSASVLKRSPDVYCLSGNGRRLPNRTVKGLITTGGPKFNFHNSRGQAHKLIDGSTSHLNAMKYESRVLFIHFAQKYHINWVLFHTWNNILQKPRRKFKGFARLNNKTWMPAESFDEDIDPYHIWRKYNFGSREYKHLLFSTTSGAKLMTELIIYGY